jgi:PspA-Associated protein
MIVRIMGEGQFDVPDGHLDELNRLDDALAEAVESGDTASFRTALESLLTSVRTQGSELPDDYLGPSDLVLPGPDATIDEVRAVLGEEGLIPG